ncbi:MAG: UDP-N-acetylmuramoyl-tripeptide--D-alanyl-D-alanine ligase [Proteobacteria bacterium]|nr:UDP-N-acetylmuramoyl-tripeptide--D-alanyl-D-alanine ligase [Pseudomonadota bacterium]
MADLGWTLSKIAGLVSGRLTRDPNSIVRQIATDSRQDVKGALFLALRGEHFDGHNFLHDAAKKGTIAALVEKPLTDLGIPQIQVENSLKALQTLGLERRREFQGPLVGITGSSGKTTTRRLLASILGERYITHQPIRNYNNHIGVPLTLLNLEARHEAAVLELGCSDFNEIAELTKYADPDVALITNVGPAHLEKLGDLEGVAKAKGELFLGMREEATAVVNLDDHRIAALPIRAGKRISFGTSNGALVKLIQRSPSGMRGQDLVFDIQGRRMEGSLPLIGSHNAMNALAAAAAALAVGLGPDEIAKGLAAATPEPGRLTLKEGPQKTIIVDDTYNANPASMRAAVAASKELSEGGRTIAVLGDMLELGDQTEKEHLSLGRHIVDMGIELLVTMGEGGALINRGASDAGFSRDKCLSASDQASAADLVQERINEGDIVLVKGSRGMQMEKVVLQLLTGRG